MTWNISQKARKGVAKQVCSAELGPGVQKGTLSFCLLTNPTLTPLFRPVVRNRRRWGYLPSHYHLNQ